MTTFATEVDGNITAFASRKDAEASKPEALLFGTEEQLSSLAAGWPISQLVSIWNGFAGIAPFAELRPVKKFENRQIAVSRIWVAVQRLAGEEASVVPQAAQDAPKAREVKPKASKREKARTKAQASQPRDGSKKAEVLDLMRRKQGATLAEIMKATGWQAHTVRGFMAGTLGKKMGIQVESFRSEDKERTYRVA